MAEEEPDLVALYDAEDVRRLTDAQRDQIAAEIGRPRTYVDALIAKMAEGWERRDPDYDAVGSGGAITHRLAARVNADVVRAGRRRG
jgi:hypothetical protein